MTREEYQLLKAELERLKTGERNNISEKFRIARSFGDLSENSEYDEAKNDQARIEAQICRLEEQIKNVVVVDNVDTKAVAVGTKVTLLDLEFNEQHEYRVSSSVTTGESMSTATVTTDSPVGQAILGKKVGDMSTLRPQISKPIKCRL
jgi:transcription elongation factor GreA